MNKLKKLFALELKNLLAGRAVVIGLALICIASLYSFYHGKSVITRQRQVINDATRLQAEQFDYLTSVTPPEGEAGGLLYYYFFHTRHEPSAWAAFSLGVRDVNPYNVKIRLLNLESHIYDSDLNNPVTLAAGNFDFAFVIIFLFPLLIAALTHNLISAEQEGGTWSLLRSQPTRLISVLWLKLFVRLCVVVVPAAVLFAIGCVYLHIPFDIRIAYAAAIILLYFAFWFGVALIITAFNRSSTFNALTMLGVWLTLTIIAPLLINVLVATYYPVPEALEATVRQRQGYHEGWDKPKQETMTQFYRRYPQWAAYPVPPDKFSWGWYYAMHQVGDDAAAEASSQLRNNLHLRQQRTRNLALWLPPANAQLLFNNLANTDLDAHLAYLDSIRAYHEQLKNFFHPYVFRNATVAETRWQDAPQHLFRDEARKVDVTSGLIALTMAALGLLAFGAWRMRD